jgi:hypothetical protein
MDHKFKIKNIAEEEAICKALYGEKTEERKDKVVYRQFENNLLLEITIEGKTYKTSTAVLIKNYWEKEKGLKVYVIEGYEDGKEYKLPEGVDVVIKTIQWKEEGINAKHRKGYGKCTIKGNA